VSLVSFVVCVCVCLCAVCLLVACSFGLWTRLSVWNTIISTEKLKVLGEACPVSSKDVRDFVLLVG
jgi:hypothetical protein